MNVSSPRPVRAASASFFFLAFFVFFFGAMTIFPAPAAAETPPKEGLRHGSRAKAGDGTLVVYDKVNGIYRVPDRSTTYWVDDTFYQYENGVWLESKVLAGPWALTPQHLVPDLALDRHAPPKTAVKATLPSGREAVFEPRLKVFKVAGRKGVFLFDARFYRYEEGIWFESKKDDGPWTPTSMKLLPVALRKAVPLPEGGTKVTLPSNEVVVYDAEKKIFRVENKPDTFLFDGTFYERRNDEWFAAPGAPAGYQEIQLTKVPSPVRMVYRKPPDPDKKKAEGRLKGERKTGQKTAKNDKSANKKAQKKEKPSSDTDEEE